MILILPTASELNAVIVELNVVIVELNAVIVELNAVIVELNAVLAELNALLSLRGLHRYLRGGGIGGLSTVVQWYTSYHRYHRYPVEQTTFYTELTLSELPRIIHERLAQQLHDQLRGNYMFKKLTIIVRADLQSA